jgi:Tfp pilus assembly protein PilV
MRPNARFVHRRRRGVALIEVLVALTILATAGTALLAMASASSRAVAQVREAERGVHAASSYLEIVALWPREDLDRHLGDGTQGRWRMRVERVTPTLYSVHLLDSSGVHEVLRTALYRPLPLDGTEARNVPR